MHNIKYKWKGPEQALGTPVVVARQMSILAIEDNSVTLSAEGSFTFRDHAEGCDGEDPWVATGTFLGDKFEWSVRRKDPGPDEFVWTGKDGEPLFCIDDAINAAIKEFVAGKLTRVVLHMRENPGREVNIVDEPRQYEGPQHEYTGPCICSVIIADPFDWSKNTDGGKYPTNCFKCSCGQGWFCCNPNESLWVKVGDSELWSLLIRYNGVVVECVGLDPDVREPTLALSRSLRQRGYVPTA